MNIITGRTGTPHVTAQQDRDIHAGILGDGMYVLPVGEQFAAEQQSSNVIRIKDGTLMLQGCAASIEAGEFEDVTIENGSQGMGRIDLITAHYHLDTSTGYESVELRVIKGTPAASGPQQPAYASGIIRDGAQDVDMPLYAITLDGVTITEIDPLFTVLERSLVELAKSQKILWQGVLHMMSENTVELSEPVSEQPNGIVLVFSRCADNKAVNAQWSFHYIPKGVVILNLLGNGGVSLFSQGYFLNEIMAKYLYITDKAVKGHERNRENSTASGVTYENNAYVLRYVLGV